MRDDKERPYFTTIFLCGYGNNILNVINTYAKFKQYQKQYGDRFQHRLVFLNIDLSNHPSSVFLPCCRNPVSFHQPFGGHVFDSNAVSTLFDIYPNLPRLDVLPNHEFLRHTVAYQQLDKVTPIRLDRSIVTHEFLWLPLDRIHRNLPDLFKLLSCKWPIHDSVTRYDAVIHMRFQQSTDNLIVPDSSTSASKLYWQSVNNWFRHSKCSNIRVITNQTTEAQKLIDSITTWRSNTKFNEGRVQCNTAMHIDFETIRNARYVICIGLSTFSLTAALLNPNPFKSICYTNDIQKYYAHAFSFRGIPQMYCIDGSEYGDDDILLPVVYVDVKDGCYAFRSSEHREENIHVIIRHSVLADEDGTDTTKSFYLRISNYIQIIRRMHAQSFVAFCPTTIDAIELRCSMHRVCMEDGLYPVMQCKTVIDNPTDRDLVRVLRQHMDSVVHSE